MPKQEESKLIMKQIEANKNDLIKLWKLKNIIFKSNWSLKHFNSYLLALKNFTLNQDTHFEGFTLVLTNNLPSGLRKNGHIHLNCAQVYEEWLNVNFEAEFFSLELNLNQSFKILKDFGDIEKELEPFRRNKSNGG